MSRFKCTVSYDGYDYMGFQVQDNLKTIELAITDALERLLNTRVKIYASGRTDRYVHALGQVFHFDTNLGIKEMGIKKGLNSFLPDDIHIISVEKVSEDFHARFSATSKEYRYYINTGEYNPLSKRYMPTMFDLDYEKMAEAIRLFIGTHDFKGFASASIDERKDTVKTIFDARVNKLEDKLEFVFIGTGFLKYQVRRMMGLLIEIGFKKENKEKILEVFEKKDPRISHKIADGCGLVLYKVNYDTL